MNNIWRWFFGIVIALALLGLIFAGHSERKAYRIAHGQIEQQVINTQDRIFAVAQSAIKAVDLATARAGNLPAQQAIGEEIKQHIEETAYALILITDARGDVKTAQLDKAIEQFNNTLQAVDDASKQADNPEVKSALDRIYGILEGAKEQLAQAIANMELE